jgi:hypothetical protein
LLKNCNSANVTLTGILPVKQSVFALAIVHPWPNHEEYDGCESEPKSQRMRVATAAAPHLDSGMRKAFNQETEQILGIAASAPPLDSWTRKPFNQETEQEQLHGGKCLGESAPQSLHLAVIYYDSS